MNLTRSLCILALAAPWSLGAAPAGRVLNLRGTWVRETLPREIRPGMLVQQGDLLWAVSARKQAVAEFILYNGQTFRCEADQRCEIPSASPPPKSLWERMTARPETPRLVFTMARGQNISDAVCLYAHGSLDLAAALVGLDRAVYRISLRNLTGPSSPIEFAYDWQPRSAQPVSVSLTPGLYELNVVTPEEAVLGPAAVRIVEAGGYKEARRQFEDALANATRAQTPLSELARRQFALAVLDALQ